jgi:hypothetical protein
LVETFEAAECHNTENQKILLDFSLGRITDVKAMRLLLIDSEEDLYLMMAQAHFPMPRFSEKVTNKMVESLHKLLS